MNSKCFGAILVILGCGGFGFSMAAAYRREEKLLRQLLDILQYLYCELQFHLTPLPELCRNAGKQGRGTIYDVFSALADVLDGQNLPQVSDCVYMAMGKSELSPAMRELMMALGQTLGQFDLSGQLLGLESLRQRCGQTLEFLVQGKEDRVRSYQTLGLCAGAALVILFV